jgi:hypothetical protein
MKSKTREEKSHLGFQIFQPLAISAENLSLSSSHSRSLCVSSFGACVLVSNRREGGKEGKKGEGVGLLPVASDRKRGKKGEEEKRKRRRKRHAGEGESGGFGKERKRRKKEERERERDEGAMCNLESGREKIEYSSPTQSSDDTWQDRISFYLKPQTTINYSRTPSNFISIIYQLIFDPTFNLTTFYLYN